MPDIAQTRRFGFLTRDAAVLVDLSSDKVTMRLRTASNTRLSAPEHHRYVRVLDWKVSRGSGERVYGGASVACKCRQTGSFRLFSIVVNGFRRYGCFKKLQDIKDARPESSFVTGIELFVDGGRAQIQQCPRSGEMSMSTQQRLASVNHADRNL
jgi:hypothetical protein